METIAHRRSKGRGDLLCALVFVLIAICGLPGAAHGLQVSPMNAPPGTSACHGLPLANIDNVKAALAVIDKYVKTGVRGSAVTFNMTEAMCRASLAPTKLLVGLLIRYIANHDYAIEINHTATGPTWTDESGRNLIVSSFLTTPLTSETLSSGASGVLDYTKLKFMHGGINPTAQACYRATGEFVSGNTGPGQCNPPNVVRTYAENLPFQLQTIQATPAKLKEMADGMPESRVLGLKIPGSSMEYYTLDHRRVMMIAMLSQVTGVKYPVKYRKVEFNHSTPNHDGAHNVLVAMRDYLDEIEARASARPLTAAGNGNRYAGQHDSGDCVELEAFPVNFCTTGAFAHAGPSRVACQALFDSVVSSTRSMCLHATP
jgi:hypothetical protein